MPDEELDHLKHRTGSLGGDQDEIPIEFREQYDLNRKWLDLPTPEKPRSLNSIESILRSDWNRMAQRVGRAEAALAQKTRECEELKEKHAYFISLYEPQHKQALEERDAARAQVEQLGRQVAEISSASETLITMLEATDTCLRSWNGTGSPVNIEYGIEQVRLASRARTK